MTVADDRDALIATLTEEGWEPNVHGSGVLTAPNGWHVIPSSWAALRTNLTNPIGVVVASFSISCPVSVILAAARAAVEADGAA